MNCDQFNQHLCQLSSLYTKSQLQKRNLSKITTECIIQNILSFQIQAKLQQEGFIYKKRILEWLNSGDNGKLQRGSLIKKQINSNKLVTQRKKYSVEQLNEILPFEKVSLTALITICTDGLAKQYKQIQKYQSLSSSSSNAPTGQFPLQTIITILRLQLQMRQIRKKVIPMTQLYIPMAQKNLTLDELKDYLLLGQNSLNKHNDVNPRNVMLALNGNAINWEYLEFQFYASLRDKQTQSPKQTQAKKNQQFNSDRIAQVMERLNKRVDNFGKEWLINKP